MKTASVHGSRSTSLTLQISYKNLLFIQDKVGERTKKLEDCSSNQTKMACLLELEDDLCPNLQSSQMLPNHFYSWTEKEIRYQNDNVTSRDNLKKRKIGHILSATHLLQMKQQFSVVLQIWLPSLLTGRVEIWFQYIENITRFLRYSTKQKYQVNFSGVDALTIDKSQISVSGKVVFHFMKQAKKLVVILGREGKVA